MKLNSIWLISCPLAIFITASCDGIFLWWFLNTNSFRNFIIQNVQRPMCAGEFLLFLVEIQEMSHPSIKDQQAVK